MTVKQLVLMFYIFFVGSALVGAFHIATWVEHLTRVQQVR